MRFPAPRSVIFFKDVIQRRDDSLNRRGRRKLKNAT
jgi:hypothetical protein